MTSKITGNKGEWSKLYVFFQLLADGKILSNADSYPILEVQINKIKAIRSNTPDKFYSFLSKKSGQIIREITVDELIDKTIGLLHSIHKGRGSFDIPEIEDFIYSLGIENLNIKLDKNKDLTILLEKKSSNYRKTLSFKIFSRIGGLPSLFNASSGTNFVYLIENLKITKEKIIQINTMKVGNKLDVRGRVQEIYKNGGQMVYVRTQNNSLENNLRVIDGDLPIILSELLLSYFGGKGSKLVDLLDGIKRLNPCNYSETEKIPVYENKIKNLLLAMYLGMKTSKPWDGQIEISDGLIILEDNGNVSCYHGFNKRDFQDFLLKNTKFETPAVKRHEYAKIYIEGEKLFFKLNLQIRLSM